MAYSPQEIDKLRGLFKKYKYYPVDSSLTPERLTDLNLYRKMTVGGKASYILFHKKGSPISGNIPAALYVAEEDMDAYIALAGEVVPAPEQDAPVANSMTSGDYEKEVLENPDLNVERKIELTLESAGEVMENIFERAEIDAEHINNIRQVGENLNRFIQTVIIEKNEGSRLLERLIGHDYYTYSHSIHVSLYCGILASEMDEHGVRSVNGSIRYLCLGALMHDIGKIRVDRGIINKRGRLTPAEFEQIKKHPSLGAEIVKIAREHPDVVTVIREHHEQWGGGGYPLGLRGERISELGRVACICDVFDALTTRRSYRAAMLPFDALSLMLHSMQDHFYRPYLQFFIKLLGRMAR